MVYIETMTLFTAYLLTTHMRCNLGNHHGYLENGMPTENCFSTNCHPWCLRDAGSLRPKRGALPVQSLQQLFGVNRCLFLGIISMQLQRQLSTGRYGCKPYMKHKYKNHMLLIILTYFWLGTYQNQIWQSADFSLFLQRTFGHSNTQK